MPRVPPPGPRLTGGCHGCNPAASVSRAGRRGGVAAPPRATHGRRRPAVPHLVGLHSWEPPGVGHLGRLGRLRAPPFKMGPRTSRRSPRTAPRASPRRRQRGSGPGADTACPSPRPVVGYGHRRGAHGRARRTGRGGGAWRAWRAGRTAGARAAEAGAATAPATTPRGIPPLGGRADPPGPVRRLQRAHRRLGRPPGVGAGGRAPGLRLLLARRPPDARRRRLLDGPGRPGGAHRAPAAGAAGQLRLLPVGGPPGAPGRRRRPPQRGPTRAGPGRRRPPQGVRPAGRGRAAVPAAGGGAGRDGRPGARAVGRGRGPGHAAGGPRAGRGRPPRVAPRPGAPRPPADRRRGGAGHAAPGGRAR